VKGVAALIFEM